jgi:hypothetical protein
MAEQLFRSQLGRTPAGYRWVQAVLWDDRWVEVEPWEDLEEKPPKWFLTDGIRLSNPAPQELENPTQKNPQLFLEFARLKPLQDKEWKIDDEKKQISPPALGPDSPKLNGIRDFANRYGLLGGGEHIAMPEEPVTAPLMGESYDFWEKEIDNMYFAVELWKMLRPIVDKERLQQVIRWEPDDIVFYDPSGQWKKHAVSSWESISHVTPLKKGEYEKAAWCYLVTAVNQSRIHVQPQSYRLLSPRLEFEQYRPTVRVGLHFSPTTRLGELWLQFAQAIDQGREYRQCPYCNEAFIVGAGVKQNKKREYCTDSHRALAWRKRKVEQQTQRQKRKKAA